MHFHFVVIFCVLSYIVELQQITHTFAVENLIEYFEPCFFLKQRNVSLYFVTIYAILLCVYIMYR